MNTERIRPFTRFHLILPFAMLLAGGGYAGALTGPASQPPGGVTIIDSDTGEPEDKEAWGRAGGRTFVFGDFQLNSLAQLYWGPEDGAAVSIAFDGAVDTVEEFLPLTIVGPGVAEGTGHTTVMLYNGASHPVDTRFRLTVTDINGNLVPLVANPLTGLPAVDILALPSNASGEVAFAALLEMQAKVEGLASSFYLCDPSLNPPDTDGYAPALDLYDCLQTWPDAVRPVLTSFDSGFFYELGDVFGLGEHDAHIADLINGLEGSLSEVGVQVQFLFEDWPLVVAGWQTQFTEVKNSLASLLGSIQSLGSQLNSLSDTVAPMASQLDDLAQRIDGVPSQDLILFLFGLTDFMEEPDAFPPFEVVRLYSPLYQALDDLQEMQFNATKLEVSATRLQPDSEGHPRLLVLLTVNGQKVDGDVVAVEAINDNGGSVQAAVVPFQATSVSEGVIALSLNSQGDWRSAHTFTLQAVYQVDSQAAPQSDTILVNVKQ